MDGHIKTGTTANKKRASATPVFPIPYPFFDSASRAGRLPRWIQRKTCGHKSMSAPFPIYTCERQFAFALQKTTPNPQLRMLIHILPTKTTSPIVACNARKKQKETRLHRTEKTATSHALFNLLAANDQDWTNVLEFIIFRDLSNVHFVVLDLLHCVFVSACAWKCNCLL